MPIQHKKDCPQNTHSDFVGSTYVPCTCSDKPKCSDRELKSECSGCHDLRNDPLGGTHQGCTSDHGHIGCELAEKTEEKKHKANCAADMDGCYDGCSSEDWKEKLFELSEQYCKHDDNKYNSCLYHIFLPFIESVRNGAVKEERARIQNLLENTELADGFVGFSDKALGPLLEKNKIAFLASILEIREQAYKKGQDAGMDYSLQERDKLIGAKMKQAQSALRRELRERILATKDSSSAFMVMKNEKGEIEDWTLPVSEVLAIINQEK